MIVFDCMASKAYCGREAAAVAVKPIQGAKNELAAAVAVKPPSVNCGVSVWPMRCAILERAMDVNAGS